MIRPDFNAGRTILIFLGVLAAVTLVGIATKGAVSAVGSWTPVLSGLALILISTLGRPDRFTLARWLLRLAGGCYALTLLPLKLAPMFQGVAIIAATASALLWFVETSRERRAMSDR